jgi:Na+/phosphate symporter
VGRIDEDLLVVRGAAAAIPADARIAAASGWLFRLLICLLLVIIVRLVFHGCDVGSATSAAT